MKQEPKDLYTSPFFSRDYFSNVMLPISVEAGQRTTSQPVPFTQHDDMLILFVADGSGRIIVNSKEYTAERGLMLCLNPFHFPLLIPEKGAALTLWECRFTVGTSLYLGGCPYNPVKSLDMPYAPQAAVLPDEISRRVEAIMSQIEKCGDSENEDSLCFTLLIKLFGYLLKYMQPPLVLPGHPWSSAQSREESVPGK